MPLVLSLYHYQYLGPYLKQNHKRQYQPTLFSRWQHGWCLSPRQGKNTQLGSWALYLQLSSNAISGGMEVNFVVQSLHSFLFLFCLHLFFFFSWSMMEIICGLKIIRLAKSYSLSLGERRCHTSFVSILVYSGHQSSYMTQIITQMSPHPSWFIV